MQLAGFKTYQVIELHLLEILEESGT